MIEAPASQVLARARALQQAGRPWPPDLQASILCIAEDALPSVAVRLARDAHLRSAGAVVGGGLFARVQAIQSEEPLILRAWPRLLVTPPPAGSLRRHTFEAMQCSRLRRLPGRRQLLRILASAGDIDARAMSPGGG